MIRPRWKKVISDLGSNKSRTLLVVLSIFIGVFATGVINGARAIVVNELRDSYDKTNPAHATFFVTEEDSFDDDMVAIIGKIDGVADVEGRRTTRIQVAVAPDTWEGFQLTAIPDFSDIKINQLTFEQGAAKPRDTEVLLERSSMKLLNIHVGDMLTVERSDGKHKLMHVAGVVHDLAVRPTSMSGTYYGYVTSGTMEWLNESPGYTQLVIRVAPETPNTQNVATSTQPSIEQITHVIDDVISKMKKSGRDPQTPRGPHGGPSNEHWATSFISTLSTMMSFLGVMALFLSGFLVTNTISAIIAQQIRQIGIMKAIGARSQQIVAMFIVLVFGFGTLSLLLAIPLTLITTQFFVNYVSNYFNFDLSQARFPTNVLVIQAFASIVVPIIASLAPVFMGTRITVNDAFNHENIYIKKNKKKNRFLRFLKLGKQHHTDEIDSAVTTTKQPKTRGSLLAKLLNRPLLLSVRNTFRHKGRVTLTIATLTLGGVIFINIFTIRDSLLLTLDDLIAREFNFDMIISFERSYNDYYVIEQIMRVPGIINAESWTSGSVTRVYADGNESKDISVNALPPTTTMIDPSIVDGRWLVPDDENALVVTIGTLVEDPDITVGSTIILKVNDKDTQWTVVGIATGIGDSREAYVNYDYYTVVIGEVGKTRVVRIQTEPGSVAQQQAIADRLEQHLERQSIDVGATMLMHELRQRIMERFNFIVIALLIMAFLMAVVGGLGLAGTMSLNVIERTKEIGIMRAIGASNRMMIQIFMGEGLLIGGLSWLLGTTLAFPLSKLICDTIGNMLFRMPLSFQFAINGVVLWFVVSMSLAMLASFFPAWNASRVTVREVLAYE